MLKFTIITATILRPGLEKACKSIQNQKYTNWEHIVVVDVPGTDIDQYLAEHPELSHPNRKWFVCPIAHNNVGNSCRSSVYNKINPDTDYVIYLDDDNWHLGESLTILDRELCRRNEPNWGVFPIFQFGKRLFDLNPGKERTDTNQIYHKPMIGGQPIRFLNRNEYATDGLMVEWLKTLDKPVMVNTVDLARTDSKGYGVRGSVGKDPYTIVIPNKYPDILMKAFESWFRFRTKPVRVIVVGDNHSHKFYNFETLESEGKFIFSKSANIGIRAAEPDDVILMNDDVHLTHLHSLQWLFEAAYSDQSIGIISPLIDGAVGNVYQNSWRARELWKDCPAVYGDIMYRGGTSFDYVSFACVYLKRAMLDQIGLMDEYTFVDYGRDDTDLCIRAVRAGWRIAITRKVVMRHGEGGVDYCRGKNWNVTFSRDGRGDSKVDYFSRKYPDEPKIPLWPQPHAPVPEQFKDRINMFDNRLETRPNKASDGKARTARITTGGAYVYR